MRKEYHRLVRDRIPEIIHQRGEHAEVITLNEHDYSRRSAKNWWRKPRQAAMATEEELVTELADLLEVMEATFEHFWLEPGDGTPGTGESAI